MFFKALRITIICFSLLSFAKVGFTVKSEWNVEKSQHFEVYYKNVPEDFVKEVEDAAEGYYYSISKNLGFARYKGWSVNERAKIYIYDDQDDYLRNARQAGWSHGVAYVRQKKIQTFPSDSGFFDALLPHELGHIIFREFIGYDVRIPLWLEEGVAMNQERSRRLGAHKKVEEFINDGSFIPLERLNLSGRVTNEDVHRFYAESASIVNFMLEEYGASRFDRFCEKIKSGYPFKSSLSSVYIRFETVEELNEKWVEFLTE